MRGEVERQRELSVVSAEHRIPADHPLRRIKALADAELARLSPVFDRMYAERGRPSVPPERLLAADHLPPPEDLLDLLAAPLAHAVAGMAQRPPVQMQDALPRGAADRLLGLPRRRRVRSAAHGETPAGDGDGVMGGREHHVRNTKMVAPRRRAKPLSSPYARRPAALPS